MKAEISIPENLTEVSLHNFQKLMEVIENNPDSQEFIQLKTVEYICDLPPNLVTKIRKADFDSIVVAIDELFQSQHELKRTFTHQGKEFGFIPKLDDLSVGEFADLTNYFDDWKQMHKAMAVLFRPITQKHKNQYLIEEYEGSEKYAMTLRDMPLDVVLGARFFFLILGLELSLTTLRSSSRELQEITELQQILEQSGVGISHFTHSLEGMLYELKMPKN